LLGLKKQLSHRAAIQSEGEPITLAATGRSTAKEVVILKINHWELPQQACDAKPRCKTHCCLPDCRRITAPSAISACLQDPALPIKLHFCSKREKASCFSEVRLSPSQAP